MRSLNENDILTYASRALWNSIPKNLNAVTIHLVPDQQRYIWMNYFHKPPSLEEIEVMSEANAELYADIYGETFNKTMEKNIVNVQPVLTNQTLLVYKSFDPSFKGVLSDNEEGSFGTIIRVGLQALNGLANMNLVKVYVDFTKPFKEVVWYPFFETPPTQEDINLQLKAASTFASAFLTKPTYRVVQEKNKEVLPQSQLIFGRCGS